MSDINVYRIRYDQTILIIEGKGSYMLKLNKIKEGLSLAIASTIAAGSLVLGSGSDPAQAAIYSGWHTVGLGSKADPKIVFDVPPEFHVDGTVRTTAGIASSGGTVPEELSAAAVGTDCDNWPRSLAYIEHLVSARKHQFAQGTALRELGRSVLSRKLASVGLTQAPVNMTRARNYRFLDRSATRVDGSAHISNTAATCGASSVKITVISINHDTRFVFIRDVNGEGALSASTASKIIRSVRKN